MKCSIERGTLGDEPVYFPTCLWKNHVNCYFPSGVWVAKWPVMPFPIEYLLTSEVTLKSLFPPPLKCKHSLWQLLLTFHLEDNKSYFRKCGKNRWLHWCFAASKVSCQEHQNLQTFKTLLLSSPHPRKTFNFKFQLGFSSNGFKLKLSHWKIG